MDDLTQEILRTAVTLARNERIFKVVDLKARLMELFPQNADKCDAAIQFWANNA